MISAVAEKVPSRSIWIAALLLEFIASEKPGGMTTTMEALPLSRMSFTSLKELIWYFMRKYPLLVNASRSLRLS